MARKIAIEENKDVNNSNNFIKLILVIFITLILVAIIVPIVSSSINNKDDSLLTDYEKLEKQIKEEKKFYDKIMKQYNKAEHIYKSTVLDEHLLININGDSYNCSKITEKMGDCYKINFNKNGSNVLISYIYDNKYISKNCIEDNGILTCYMNDGVRVSRTYVKER